MGNAAMAKRLQSFIGLLAMCIAMSAFSSENDEWTLLESRLATLEQCEQYGTCPQDPNNPRNSFYLLGEEISIVLDDVALWQETYGSTVESRELLHRYLRYPNEFVQAKSLSIIAGMTADKKTCLVLLEMLPRVRDRKVMIPLLVQLQRYPDAFEAVDSEFEKILLTGSFEGGKVIAQHIQPFINQQNIAFYRSLYEKMPEKSAKAIALGKALERVEANF